MTRSDKHSRLLRFGIINGHDELNGTSEAVGVLDTIPILLQSSWSKGISETNLKL
jgi:hypothetical protein